MNAFVDRIAQSISHLIRIQDLDFPHNVAWTGRDDDPNVLTEEEREERRAIVRAVIAAMCDAVLEGGR